MMKCPIVYPSSHNMVIMEMENGETIISEGPISPLPWSAETPMEPVGDCEDHHDAPGSEVGNEAVCGGHVRSPGI